MLERIEPISSKIQEEYVGNIGIVTRWFCTIFNFNNFEGIVRLCASTKFRVIAEARSSDYYAKENIVLGR